MKLFRRICVLSLFAGLLISPAATLHAQQKDHSPSEQQGRQWSGTEDHMDAPETESSVEKYRHSSVVQAIARVGHMKVETAAQIFEDFNSTIMVGSILFFLWKVLPKMFRQRSQTIQKELSEAQLATEEANRRLAAVEARLSRLDTEIESVRRQVEAEAAEDEKRILATLETERERIVATAEQEIAAAQAAAQRELKKFAADLAVDQAMRKIQLSADTDRALVRDFGKNLNTKSGGRA